MSVWGVGCTGAHEQLLQNVGLVSAEANRVSLVKHSRQVQAIQRHASFQLRGSEQGRQPMERALDCSLLLHCVFCHHLLEPHGQ